MNDLRHGKPLAKEIVPVVTRASLKFRVVDSLMGSGTAQGFAKLVEEYRKSERELQIRRGWSISGGHA
jgi:hypothetical protein